jgi:hypothetical protein
VEKRPDHDLERRRGPDDFFGLDVDSMSPRAQITTSLAVLIPVAVGAVLVFTLVPWLWWLIFVFGWMIFPAFGLLVRGVAGISEGEGRTELPAGNSKERELLEALRTRGELTPAEGGHLEVRVRGGGLFVLRFVGARRWRRAGTAGGPVGGMEDGSRGIIHAPRVAAREIVSVG